MRLDVCYFGYDFSDCCPHLYCFLLKHVSQVESFLCPDKQGTPEESWRIQWPQHCVSTNNNKDEDNSPKNHNQKRMRIQFNT